MLRPQVFLVLAAIGLLSLGLAGCGKKSQKSSSPPAPSPGAAKPAGEAAQEKQAGGEPAAVDLSQYTEVLAQLSLEDRALAEKQKTCPVSHEPLGSMGKPYKVTVQGRDVLLCCQGCEAEIKADPDKYLAHLPR